jgi:hypothetical protein
MARTKLSFPSLVPPACYQMAVGRIARELRWTNGEFSLSTSHIMPWLSMLIHHLGDEK